MSTHNEVVLQKEIVRLTRRAESRSKWWKIPYKAIQKVYTEPCARGGCVLPMGKSLKIAVVAVPCHGFGDVIFATKLTMYLKEWYPTASLMIYTTNKRSFLTLGLTGVNIVALLNGNEQCRRLKHLKAEERITRPDLILVAPHMADFKVDYEDIKYLFENSNPFNTMFFSEYQDSLRKGYDFPTGIGPKRLGLLFDDVKPSERVIYGPYILTYIARNVGPVGCFYNFVGMVVRKYRKRYPKLQIVLPEWLAIEASEENFNKFKHHVRGLYDSLEVRTKSKEVEMMDISSTNKKRGKKSVLILRGDVLPVSRKKMLGLMKYSLSDMLVTGDQSLTDALGCCSNKNIFYQTATWKRSLLQSLHHEMPKGPYRTMSEACGNLRYIKWKGKYRKFLKNNDFRIGGKVRLDAVVRSIVEYKKPGSFVKKYIDAVKRSYTKQSLIKKLKV